MTRARERDREWKRERRVKSLPIDKFIERDCVRVAVDTSAQTYIVHATQPYNEIITNVCWTDYTWNNNNNWSMGALREKNGKWQNINVFIAWCDNCGLTECAIWIIHTIHMCENDADQPLNMNVVMLFSFEWASIVFCSWELTLHAAYIPAIVLCHYHRHR